MKFTKEQFIDCLERIKRMYQEESSIRDSLGVAEWVPSTWIDSYVELFNEMCELPENKYYGTDVDYFMYELDFGRKWKPGMVTDENGNDVKLTTAEELWDSLQTK